ncbi:MAG TPA: N-acetylmuramic acid 6-phosphate etherase [Candidatus Dormibacteraeota bacterium]|nr:N-acetylmuramic acid 6-phosphate etherase [Candidatus Dormibacteraeota bacterium]
MSESVHPRADELESLTTLELVELMHAEELRAHEAIHPQLGEIARAIEVIVERLRSGGRLHYFGAGTSGRIAALDAAECPATFGIAADLVQAHEGGDDEQEDERHRGRDHAQRSGVGSGDVALGISASGTTAYVLSAIDAAKAVGAVVVALTCTPGSPLGQAADIAIEIETGPEVIAGSTRLKAGTVQKVTLNMISTGTFTRLGHTYRGRMVNVVATNDKRRTRDARLVAELGGTSMEGAARALSDARGNTKAAILMLRRGVSAQEAEELLSAAGGNLNATLTEARRP